MNNVITVFKNYFDFSIHPFKMQQGRLANRLGLVELVSVSWVFVIFQAFYSIVGLNIGGFFLRKLHNMEDGSIPDLLIPGGSEEALAITIFITLFSVVLFPLFGILYVKVWNVIISFFSELFGKKGIRSEQIDMAANAILVSNIFLIFPIVGELFKSLSKLVYLFAGLRDNLGFSPTQSVIVILSPLILTTVFIMILFIIILMLITSF